MDWILRIVYEALIPLFEDEEPNPNNASWGVVFFSFILACIGAALLLSD